MSIKQTSLLNSREARALLLMDQIAASLAVSGGSSGTAAGVAADGLFLAATMLRGREGLERDDVVATLGHASLALLALCAHFGVSQEEASDQVAASLKADLQERRVES